jgi:ubiquinone/menaquinone biosynthesis C-methylase UbiE
MSSTDSGSISFPTADRRNADEIAYWNGPGGQRWLNRQQVHDALLAPIGEVLLDRAQAREGEFVLDIGCGCGAMAIALARLVAPTGRVLGIDVSGPMLERARQLAPANLPVEFALADATTHPFKRGQASLLCSRFGVMFFAEPVRSFENMRAGLRSGARIAFTCWREFKKNAWALVPLQQAYRHVPRLPELGPEDPGPFSFASPPRVRAILEQAGFEQIDLQPVDLLLDLAGGRGLEAAVDTAMGVGPASRALDGASSALRAAAAESIREALAPYQTGNSVPLASAVWFVIATNP